MARGMYENLAAILSNHHKVLLVRDGDDGTSRSEQVPYVSVGATVYLGLSPSEGQTDVLPSNEKVVLRLRCVDPDGRGVTELVMAGTGAVAELGDDEALFLERLGEVARTLNQVERTAPISVLKVRLWLACTTSDLRSGEVAHTDFAWVPVTGEVGPLLTG